MVSKEKVDFCFENEEMDDIFKNEDKYSHTYPKLKTYSELRNSPIRLLYKKQSTNKDPLHFLSNAFFYNYKSPVCNLNKLFESMDNVRNDPKKNECNYDTIISSPSVVQRSHTR